MQEFETNKKHLEVSILVNNINNAPAYYTVIVANFKAEWTQNV